MQSAHHAIQTRFCAARHCPHDAEPRSTLCQQHQKLAAAGVRITLHTLEPATPTLPCCTCHAHLPDEAFSRKYKNHNRRQRHSECKQCDRARAARRRAAETPEQTRARMDRETRRHQLARARKRAELHAIRNRITKSASPGQAHAARAQGVTSDVAPDPAQTGAPS